MAISPNRIPAFLRELLLLHQDGNLMDAEAGYREILDIEPENVDAIHLLGMLLHERGDSIAALKQVRKALGLQPKSAALLNSLSVVLMGAKDYENARVAAEAATGIDPEMPEPRRNLTRILRHLASKGPEFAKGEENADDQIQSLLVEIEREPHRSDRLKQLYELSEQSGRLDLVVEACVSVLKKLPSSVAAHLTLGLVFSSRIPPEQLRHFHIAEREALLQRAFHHLSIAAKQRPCPETLDAWGLALLNANKQLEAITKFDLALEYDSQFAKSLENRGRANLELGRISQAREDYSKAISINPTLGLAQLDLAKFQEDDQSHPMPIESLEQVTMSPDLRSRQRSMLHFALGHRHEKQGNTTEAFSHFRRANELKQQPASARTESWTQTLSDLREVFQPGFFERHDGGYRGAKPIFIVSMPRSGTTLVETILARHPNVMAGGELFGISDIAHTLNRRLKAEVAYPRCAIDLTSEEATSIGQEYCEDAFLQSTSNLETQPNTSCRTTDKMPTNFWHLGLIAAILPEASIVHVERDPMDVCLSCFKQNLTWPFCDLDAIVSYLEAYRDIMHHWHSVLPIPIHTIRYEELVASSEQETKRLFDFCELDWDQSCLDVSLAGNAVQTPSKWQVRQPIYQTSVASWKRYENELAGLKASLELRNFDIN